MGAARPVTPDEEEKIVAALKAGRSVRDVGAEFGRGKTTVARVAKRSGIDLKDVPHAKTAAEVHRYRAREARLEFLARAVEKAETLLKRCDEGREFQSIMTGAAIAIDKFKVEEPGGGGDRGGEIRALFEKMSEDAKNERD